MTQSNSLKLLVTLILIMLTVLACYVEDIYLLLRPPTVGQSISITIRAGQSFDYDQEKALGAKRKQALAEYIPLYNYSNEVLESAKKKIRVLRDMLPAFKEEKRAGAASLWGYLNREFDVRLERNEAERLYKYNKLDNLLEVMMTIEESVLQNKIVADLVSVKDKQTIEIFYPDSTSTQAFPADKLITIDEAHRALDEKAPQLLWQIDKKLLNTILSLFHPTLAPNLTYDQSGNSRRIEEIIARYPSVIVSYQPGDVLIPFGTILTENNTFLLEEYRKMRFEDLYEHIPWIFLVVILSIIFYIFFLASLFDGRQQKRIAGLYLLFLLIITLVIIKVCLLFTPFPYYVIPFALLPLIMLLLNQDVVTTVGTTLLGAFFVGFIVGQSLTIVLFFALGGLGAAFFAARIQKPSHVVLPSVVVGLINIAFVMVLFGNWNTLMSPAGAGVNAGVMHAGDIFDKATLMNGGWAFLGGILAGPAALVLLPILTLMWYTTPSFKLRRFIDLQHPIMRDLLVKAPGTYQHTMIVASLVQAVGDAIGADTLLLRVGAYYHDIGKIQKPNLYVENQLGGKNDHDEMEPVESARFIIGHVEKGIEIGRTIGLPDVVIDLISQHHGTQLVEFFYEKAKVRQGTLTHKATYRYPGPKPQSVEAAILMIVDAAEAASRTLRDPTRERIEKIVRVIIEKRITDGQLDECDIRTRDLGKVVQTLVDALVATSHSRVMYPWQEEKKVDFEFEELEL